MCSFLFCDGSFHGRYHLDLRPRAPEPPRVGVSQVRVRHATGKVADRARRVRPNCSSPPSLTASGPTGLSSGALFARFEPQSSVREFNAHVSDIVLGRNGCYRSQCGQDLYLNKWFFQNNRKGVFVDVGAYDGVQGSNTFFFEKELGWTGLAVEPAPAAFRRLEESRDCIKINGCAYSEDNQLEFEFLEVTAQESTETRSINSAWLSLMVSNVHNGEMLNGLVAVRAEQMKSRAEAVAHSFGMKKTRIKVPCWRLDQLLHENGIRGVDYLSIDTEGAELQVLQGMDFSKVHVNIIGLEHSTAFERIYELLTTAGFEYLGMLGFDEIFRNRRVEYSWQT